MGLHTMRPYVAIHIRCQEDLQGVPQVYHEVALQHLPTHLVYYGHSLTGPILFRVIEKKSTIEWEKVA